MRSGVVVRGSLDKFVEFVRLGYQDDVSDYFRTRELRDPDLVMRCLAAIGEYNEFEPRLVWEKLKPIIGELRGVQVGREGSPVVYLWLPYWEWQKMKYGDERPKDERQLSHEEIEELKRRAIKALREAKADEAEEVKYVLEDGETVVLFDVVRGWWD